MVQSPNSKKEKVSGISRKYPTYRNYVINVADRWLKCKQEDDNAEGLWRIRDMLYDFTDFVHQHPGGSFWLEKTKGLDITEPFESHHISTFPESMLSRYEVRKALKPRNYLLTMHDNGFYKTLKSRVRRELKNLDYTPSKRTDYIHLGLLSSTFVFALASASTNLFIFELLAALSLCWLTIAAHNYFHRRDNWQMYTFNFSLMNFNSWRISHALSHHVYPNSFHDLEMTLFEPFLVWTPDAQIVPYVYRIITLGLQFVVYTAILPFHFVERVFYSITVENAMYWHDAIPFTLPLLMWSVSDASLGGVFLQWTVIILMSSFMFGAISINSGHHDPKIHHDGDADRVDRDWGLFQMDAIIDLENVKGSQFLVLTHFGEHTLHHLFPTLDHGVLPQLYPIFLKTLEEFNLELRECDHVEQLVGQSKQLLRTKPNPIPPGS